MAATLSVYPSPDLHHRHHLSSHSKPSFKPKLKSFSTTISSIPKLNYTSCFSTSQSSSDNSISQQNPSKFGRFLTNNELKNLDFLHNYTYSCKLPSGYLCIRAMNDFQVDMIVGLLAESFAESMGLPNMYLTVLGFLVKQYLIERRTLLPHAVTLIAFFREDEDECGREDGDIGELAGTVEVSFNQKGANASPPTPTPPKNYPYICNMTVKNQYRRRGIGWHLLKASEELIANMGLSREVYLHCRLIDIAPFSMYKKAGYEVVKTDSLLILLTLQRRKHLMCKQLSIFSKPLENPIAEDEQVPPVVPGNEPRPVLFDEVRHGTRESKRTSQRSRTRHKRHM
ncbi:GCN5-related N-acetyltransferase 5, chloroplastic isoform X2 [Silene latifolia]|uniref:GCN5-related N-acetyltransferase 5, chloroplastic isoform X2 n=1 Tax=Silene latifolia TaxID=37657 RepID=UPI003D775EBA